MAKLLKKEVAVQIMYHLCTCPLHGYSQIYRWGDGSGYCNVTIGGKVYKVPRGDRDCSSSIINSFKIAGIDVGNATYTGNMRSEFVKSGNFRWHPMGSYVAKRGDVYLNERNHTAMCQSDKPDLLMQFSISENGTIRGASGDQTGHESVANKPYYNYPWDGILECINTEYADGGSAPSNVANNVSTNVTPHITYAVKTAKGIQPDVSDGAVAGNNDPIIGIKISVSSGSVSYRVHLKGKGWLDKVTGANWNDFNNGYAGDDRTPIDGLQIYYSTDTSKTSGRYYDACYKAYISGKACWLAEVKDTNWESGDGDHTAGIFGYPITKVQIHLG